MAKSPERVHGLSAKLIHDNHINHTTTCTSTMAKFDGKASQDYLTAFNKIATHGFPNRNGTDSDAIAAAVGRARVPLFEDKTNGHLAYNRTAVKAIADSLNEKDRFVEHKGKLVPRDDGWRLSVEDQKQGYSIGASRLGLVATSMTPQVIKKLEAAAAGAENDIALNLTSLGGGLYPEVNTWGPGMTPSSYTWADCAPLVSGTAFTTLIGQRAYANDATWMLPPNISTGKDFSTVAESGEADLVGFNNAACGPGSALAVLGVMKGAGAMGRVAVNLGNRSMNSTPALCTGPMITSLIHSAQDKLSQASRRRWAQYDDYDKARCIALATLHTPHELWAQTAKDGTEDNKITIRAAIRYLSDKYETTGRCDESDAAQAFQDFVAAVDTRKLRALHAMFYKTLDAKHQGIKGALSSLAKHHDSHKMANGEDASAEDVQAYAQILSDTAEQTGGYMTGRKLPKTHISRKRDGDDAVQLKSLTAAQQSGAGWTCPADLVGGENNATRWGDRAYVGLSKKAKWDDAGKWQKDWANAHDGKMPKTNVRTHDNVKCIAANNPRRSRLVRDYATASDEMVAKITEARAQQIKKDAERIQVQYGLTQQAVDAVEDIMLKQIMRFSGDEAKWNGPFGYKEAEQQARAQDGYFTNTMERKMRNYIDRQRRGGSEEDTSKIANDFINLLTSANADGQITEQGRAVPGSDFALATNYAAPSDRVRAQGQTWGRAFKSTANVTDEVARQAKQDKYRREFLMDKRDRLGALTPDDQDELNRLTAAQAGPGAAVFTPGSALAGGLGDDEEGMDFTGLGPED